MDVVRTACFLALPRELLGLLVALHLQGVGERMAAADALAGMARDIALGDHA
jgi:hypothetical protein